MLPISSNFGFPSSNVPREKKETAEYGRLVGQAIYSRWYNGAIPYGYANMAYFRTLRDYAEGRQSTLQYKKRYRGESDKNKGGVNQNNGENERRGYNNISFEINPVAPTFINVIKSVLSQSDYKPVFVSTTKSDIKTKTKMKWDLFAEAKYENQLREKMGYPIKKRDWMPQTKGEVEVFEKYHGFRLPLEVGLTKIAEQGFNVSKWPLLRDQYMDGLIQTSFIVGRVMTNRDGSCGIEYINTANFVTSYYDQTRQAEPPFAGHITKVSIESIAGKLREQGATDDDIRALARQYAGYNGISNPTSYDYGIKDPVTQRYQWYDFMVDVMIFEWKTDDPKHFVGRNAKNGNYVYKQEDRVKKQYADGRERKTDTYYDQVIYEGKFVVGTKWVYDYGLKKNMIRNADGSCALSYFFERVDKKSIVESWRSLLDDYQMAELKERAAVQAASPKGLAIDTGLLAQMDIGGGKMNGLEVARMRRETGNFYYSTPSVFLQTGKSAANTVMELENGIGKQLNEWLVLKQSIIADILRIAGITDAVAAMPNSNGEKGLGVTQIEVEATNNALYPLKTALVNFKMKAGQKLVAQTRVNMEADKKCREYWQNYLEPQEFDAVMGIEDLSLSSIGLEMRATYSPERKALIMQAATESLKAGKNGQIGINLADFMYIEKVLEEGYGELAAWYLAVAETRALQQNEAAQSRMSAENAQNSMQAAQAAQESKVRAEQMISQLRQSEESKKIADELEADLVRKQVEHNYRMQELALEASIQSTTNKDVRGRI